MGFKAALDKFYVFCQEKFQKGTREHENKTQHEKNNNTRLLFNW